MDRLLPLFLKFLRAGLWEEVIDCNVSLTRHEWEQLYEIAYRQAVTGHFIDGVSRTTMRPDEDIWERWMVHLLFMERNNRHIAARGEQWIEELKKAGIEAFVFKGMSVATWYTQPLHRSYGDVDIVVKNGWKQLPQILQGWGIEPYRENGEEIVIKEKSNLFVELHCEWEHLYNPVTDARLKRMCAAATENNNELYFVCLLVHLQRHFFTYGIGLKQVCDVAAMLHTTGLDREKTVAMLRAVNAEKFSRHLFGFIDTYLGGTENYPLPPVKDKKRLTLLENVIFGEGYSLKKRQERDAANNRHSFSRIMDNALFWSRRCARVSGLMAGEACCFLLHKAWRRVGMLFTHNAKNKHRQYMSTNFPIFHPLNLRKNRFLKRCFDILFSLTFLCLVFPFILILVFVMTKCTMPGRIFFVQKRTGLNGKIFKCIKFRSMRINNESHQRQATYRDRRITKWGFFMRKTNIDEMPQFINVLLGDMSVVGPRPHMVRHTDEFSQMVDGYMQRHFVKPGVTGLSQVKGYRGEITKLSDIKNRVRLDVFYIKHWSLKMDMSIIIRTFFKCFGNDRKAY